MPQFTLEYTTDNPVIVDLIGRLQHTARMITWFEYAIKHDGINLRMQGSLHADPVGYAKKRLEFYYERNRFIGEILTSHDVDYDYIETLFAREVAGEWQRCRELVGE